LRRSQCPSYRRHGYARWVHDFSSGIGQHSHSASVPGCSRWRKPTRMAPTNDERHRYREPGGQRADRPRDWTNRNSRHVNSSWKGLEMRHTSTVRPWRHEWYGGGSIGV
jgi:hypothetical protein